MDKLLGILSCHVNEEIQSRVICSQLDEICLLVCVFLSFLSTRVFQIHQNSKIRPFFVKEKPMNSKILDEQLLRGWLQCKAEADRQPARGCVPGPPGISAAVQPAIRQAELKRL